MKKFLVSVAFVALTSGSAFAGGTGCGGCGATPPTFSSGPITFGPQSVTNSVTQYNTTSLNNYSPANSTATAYTGALGKGATANITAASSAATWTKQVSNPSNYLSISNTLMQGISF
ncbi:MAG: hypothetical protein ACR650_03275 [Methylocystis sp.]